MVAKKKNEHATVNGLIKCISVKKVSKKKASLHDAFTDKHINELITALWILCLMFTSNHSFYNSWERHVGSIGGFDTIYLKREDWNEKAKIKNAQTSGMIFPPLARKSMFSLKDWIQEKILVMKYYFTHINAM